MSFANTTAHSEWSANSGKTYISTENFSGAFYTYTVATDSNLATIGTLTTVANAGNASSILFGRGHHLVLNGRKLTPGANPMNAITRNTTSTNNPFVFGSTPGQTTVTLSPSGASATTQTSASSTYAPKFMVGVMDVQTGLNGFIDPTNVIFALYDKNRPVSDYLVDMSAGLTAANARDLVSSGQSDRVNTTGIVLPSTGNGGTVNAGNASAGVANMDSANNGGESSLNVDSSIVTPSSIVMLTPRTSLMLALAGGSQASASFYVTVSQGRFVIRVVNNSSGTNLVNLSFNFLIIN
jgi:hypothetical protein